MTVIIGKKQTRI